MTVNELLKKRIKEELPQYTDSQISMAVGMADLLDPEIGKREISESEFDEIFNPVLIEHLAKQNPIQ